MQETHFVVCPNDKVSQQNQNFIIQNTGWTVEVKKMTPLTPHTGPILEPCCADDSHSFSNLTSFSKRLVGHRGLHSWEPYRSQKTNNYHILQLDILKFNGAPKSCLGDFNHISHTWNFIKYPIRIIIVNVYFA